MMFPSLRIAWTKQSITSVVVSAASEEWVRESGVLQVEDLGLRRVLRAGGP